MEILLGLIGLVIGGVAGRMTAPKAAAAEGDGAGRLAALEAQLAEARRAQAAAETALREAEAAPAPPAPAAPAAPAGGDADLLAAENAALRKALAAAEARAAAAALR